MDRPTNQRIIAELKKMKTKFKVDLFLFGSRARGDELLSSDVDVIAVSPKFSNMSFRERPNKFLDDWRLPVDLEILCYSPEELKRKKKEIGLVREAMSYAKAI